MEGTRGGLTRKKLNKMEEKKTRIRGTKLSKEARQGPGTCGWKGWISLWPNEPWAGCLDTHRRTKMRLRQDVTRKKTSG